MSTSRHSRPAAAIAAAAVGALALSVLPLAHAAAPAEGPEATPVEQPGPTTVDDDAPSHPDEDPASTPTVTPEVARQRNPALHVVFARPVTPRPDGVYSSVTFEGPGWRQAFDPDLAPSFRPAPAPDLFVAEPDYDGASADLVHAAAATLGQSTPWALDQQETTALLDEARKAASGILALTGEEFDRDGLLRAARELGVDASSLWDLEPADLAGAAASSLADTLAWWGQGDVAVTDPEGLTRAVRAAVDVAGVPGGVTATGLARLNTATDLARASQQYRRQTGGRLDLAAPVRLDDTLWWQQVAVTTGGATARGHLVTWLGHDDTRVEAALAGTWNSRANVVDAARRLGADVVVNGGFWVDRTDPDGLLIRDGQLLSDTISGLGIDALRGLVAVNDANVRIARRTSVRPVLRAEGQAPMLFHGTNVPQRPGERILYGPGGPAPSGPGPFWRLRDGQSPRRLDGPPSAGTGWVIAGDLPAPSATWRLDLHNELPLSQIDAALSGGPILRLDGSDAPRSWWRGEGFAAPHTENRHPRTAVGTNRKGAMMLLVIDGRRPGWSAGLTQQQTADLFEALGVTDATMLDGGGSSQLVIDGQLVNRPCCDAALRPVATVLAVDAR